MTAQEIIKIIFELVIFPILSVASIYLTDLIKNKTESIKNKYNDETLSKYLKLLNNTVSECVTAVNQTYVDTLKQQGTFDATAQKEAFRQCYQNVLLILGEDSYDYLNEAVGDLQTYITTLIETKVKEKKNE